MVKLDVGCGSFKKEGHIGIDLMPHYGIDIMATAYNLPIRNHIVTECYSSQMLEHLEHPAIFLLECNRVVKMFGDILISIPNIMHFRRFIRWTVKEKTTVARQHINAWGLPELNNLLNLFGFKFRQYGFSTHNRYHKITGISKLIKKLRPAIGDHNLEARYTKWESLDG